MLAQVKVVIDEEAEPTKTAIIHPLLKKPK
jgi:hypothetical protein